MTSHSYLPLRPAHNRQAGVSLVIVLIFLIILSGLGITAMQGSTFAARIAGNEADRNLAFQAAEAAIKDAERDLANMAWNSATNVFVNCIDTPITGCRTNPNEGKTHFAANCLDGRCAGNAGRIWEATTTWTSTRSVVYGTYTRMPALAVVAQQPRYVLEAFGNPSTGELAYRITAVGYGANASTQAFVQSAFKPKKGS